MAKKTRRRKSRYTGAASTKSAADLETRTQMRAKFPPSLIKAFVAVKETKFEDDKVYQKWVKEARSFLGDKYEDKIESGKLVVLLSRATMDMFDTPPEKKKKAVGCSKHPKYKAMRKPRGGCERCLELYNAAKKKKEEAKEETEEG